MLAIRVVILRKLRRELSGMYSFSESALSQLKFRGDTQHVENSKARLSLVLRGW